MNLNTITIGPFYEGFIRVATTPENETGTLKYKGAFEVLARHHRLDELATDATAPDAITVPRLAPHLEANALLEKEKANEVAKAIVEVPIRMFFNKTSNSISVKYQAYDADSQPVCVGDGAEAKRTSCEPGGNPVTVRTPCIGSDACVYANSEGVSCRRRVSMAVQLQGQENPLSVFEVRTSSYNSYKALRAQLELVEARFGGLRHVPLKLKLWQASNEASNFEPFDLFKLSLDASSEIEAMRAARKTRAEELECGLISDHDNTFERLIKKSEGDDIGLIADDFNEVRDFYRPVVTQRSERRRGSSSIASSIPKASRGKQAQSNIAADMISASVSGAARAIIPNQPTA